jgi:hypothetical protein
VTRAVLPVAQPDEDGEVPAFLIHFGLTLRNMRPDDYP